MRIADTATIPQLAEAAGINRRTLFRRLMALHRLHGGEWLYRGKRKIRVNTVALRAQHPSVFAPLDLSSRVEDLEEAMGSVEHETRAQAKALGQLVRRVETVEKRQSSVGRG